MWQSRERLYLTQDGRVVREGDPDAAFLLVAEGGVLPEEDARRYGLLEGSDAPPRPRRGGRRKE